MPETVEMDVPRALESWAPSCWACVRVWESVPMDVDRALERDVEAPLTWESVPRALETVSRALAMSPCVPSRSSASPESSVWTSVRSCVAFATASSAPSSTRPDRPWTFSTIVEAATSTN